MTHATTCRSHSAFPGMDRGCDCGSVTAGKIEISGRELDALVAEKVMGFQWRRAPHRMPLKLLLPPNNRFAGWTGLVGDEVRSTDWDRWVPPYSTDIASAHAVLLCFASVRYYVCVELDADGVWHCLFGVHDAASSKALPEAICLAALKAVEHFPEMPAVSASPSGGD